MADDVIRRKVAAARAMALEGGPGADRGWRLALARAANDDIGLALEVTRLAIERRSLAELLELVPERALIAVLEGPAEGLGLIALSPPVLAAMIEQQTIGRVSGSPPAPRRPTRTDAAMVAGLIDRALADLETGLAQDMDRVWAAGFRYASFLDDPRPLGLLLEEEAYRVLRAEVSLAGGVRAGAVLLALPADGRASPPVAPPDPALASPLSAAHFAQALSDQVMQTEAELGAILHRVTLPLGAVMALQPGEVVPLPMAAIGHVVVEGIDGRPLATGKLGQNRGMRAVRLVPETQNATLAAPVIDLPADRRMVAGG